MKAATCIFGATGFIGRHVVHHFSDLGHRVIPISSNEADLSDPSTVAVLAETLPKRATWVIAAVINPDRPVPARPAMMQNIRMAENLADLLNRILPGHVVYLSSVDVYGRENLALPLSESSPIRPESYYAVSKFASECILSLACRETCVPLTILRLPGVYGLGDTHFGPVHNFIEAALGGSSVAIYGDGRQRRDLVFVSDIPRVVEEIVAKKVEGLFNLVTGSTMSLNGILELIEEQVKHPVEIVYHPGAKQIDLEFQPSGLLKRLPALALTPMESGISKTYAAVRAQSG